MKKIYLFFAIATMFFVIACSNEEHLNDTTTQSNEIQFTDDELKVLYQMRSEDNKVSPEETMQLVNDVIAFLDDEAIVKSRTTRSIGSIQALTSENIQSVALKSNSFTSNAVIPDTVAYVFNFKDNAGYTIISADTRIDAPILAYTGNGTLNAETSNPGVILFLEGIEAYILQSIVDAEQKRDSLINDIVTKLDDSNASNTKALSLFDVVPRITTTTGEWTVLSKKSPLTPVEWGQGNAFNEPFWRNVRYKNCTQGTSPAGCVAVATAHIMSYWQYPTSINGQSFNWAELNKYTSFPSVARSGGYKTWLNINSAPANIQSQAAYLMESIGEKVKMKYGCDGSAAKSDDAIQYLKSIGYKGGSKCDYNYNKVINSLNNNQPVYFTGYSSKIAHSFIGITWWYSYEDGHAWIVDGYLNQRQPVAITIELLNRRTGLVVKQTTVNDFNYASYLHNNWGWHGMDNGYYLAGCFNSNEKEVASNTKSGDAYNYQYKISIFPGIYR